MDDSLSLPDDFDEEIFFKPREVLKQMKSKCWKFMMFKGTKSGGPDKSTTYCKICLDSPSGPPRGSSAKIPYNRLEVKNIHQQ